MALPLKNKVFAITGGASGIGLATAKNLFSKGATVCLADVDPEAIASAESYFSSQIPSSSSSSPVPTQNGTSSSPPQQQQQQQQSFSVTKVDVSKRGQVDAWIDGVVSRFGRLDGAANVAGVIGKGHGKDSVVDLDDDEWDRILAVNLTGMMYCLRAELRKIVDKGAIVNISSIHGTKGMTPKNPRTLSPPPQKRERESPPVHLHTHISPLNHYRIRTTRRLRRKQTRRHRPHQSRRPRKRRARSPRQRSRPGRHLHASDAKELGPEPTGFRRAV